METGRWPARLRWIIGVVLVVGLLALAAHSIDLKKFLAALASSDWRLVALAGVIVVTVCMFACSLRLYQLTAPLPHGGRGVSFWQLTSIYFASSAAHHLLPSPAAEVLRTVHLKRRYGYTIGALVASQLVEKVIDALGLSLEVLAVAIFGRLPPALDISLYVFAGLGVSGAAAVLIVAWRYRVAHAGKPEPQVESEPASGRLGGTRVKLRGFVKKLAEGTYLLRAPRIWLVSLLCSVINDFANAATAGLVLAAVGIHLPIASWFVLVLVARMAGLLPSTPGQFGVIEAGLVVALAAFGIGSNRALAVAVLYHVAHFIPVVAVGLVELRRQWQET
ncbi:MAG: lysylphosphatidylglycerol synthase transmembrane domain-containing protein [Polyangia bacterium]